jgi:hypothetical protein
MIRELSKAVFEIKALPGNWREIEAARFIKTESNIAFDIIRRETSYRGLRPSLEWLDATAARLADKAELIASNCNDQDRTALAALVRKVVEIFDQSFYGTTPIQVFGAGLRAKFEEVENTLLSGTQLRLL